MKIRTTQISIILVGLLVSLSISFLLFEISYAQKFYPNIKIANIRIGGLNPSQAKKFISELIREKEKKPIIIQHQERTWQITLPELGISFTPDLTIQKAYRIGRENNITLNLVDELRALLGYYNFNLDYGIDEEKLNRFFEENLSLIEEPAQDATLEFNKVGRDFDLVPSSEGEIIDRENFLRDLSSIINSKETGKVITLVLLVDYPEVRENEVESASGEALKIIDNAPYGLKYQDKTWEIGKETIIEFLEFIPIKDSHDNSQKNEILGTQLNEKKLNDYLVALAPTINQEPINAQFQIKDGVVTAFALSQKGVKLNIEKSIIQISKAIIDSADGTTVPLTINLEVNVQEPEIASENINYLGINALIGKGISDFTGSSSNRTHNIKVGAARFNGILIKPSEEFSFNEVLGEIGAREGYLPEYVIKKGKLVLEYGGGLCQVSTTAFRAAVNSGLEVLERYPHAFPVKYYNPQGFDATIYPPHPDLRFKNDTPGHILIQTKTEDTKLIFEFYGTEDGREIKIKGPYTLESNPDGSMKTVLYQEIYKNGEIIREKSFYSNYRSPSLYPKEENPLE